MEALSHKPKSKLIGMDKYGNKFIQYYKDDGKEWKRVMMPPDENQQKGYWHQFSEYDIRWDRWLRNEKAEPPTKEELIKSYESEAKARENAMLWEKMQK